MRRALLWTAAAGLLAASAGCATAPGPQRESEYHRLARECRERGGLFLPLWGRNTGLIAADYACELRGGGGRPRGG